MDIFIYFFEINLIKISYDTNLFEHSNEKYTKDFAKIKIDGYIYEIQLLYTEQCLKIFNNLIRKSLYFSRQVMLNKFFILIIYYFEISLFFELF